MQGFNRKHIHKPKMSLYNFDNSLCQEDGDYCPTINLNHKQFVKAGQSFPLYRGKNVRWLLVEKIKEFILCKN
jgi:hypothetical protein